MSVMLIRWHLILSSHSPGSIFAMLISGPENSYRKACQSLNWQRETASVPDAFAS